MSLDKLESLHFFLLNMDFKWLALLSFVVHLWPKLNVIFNVVQDFYVQNMKHFKIGHLNINSLRSQLGKFYKRMY